MAYILLVDDDPENLWSLQVALEGDGHRVSVADNARRALDVLQREHVQLVVTDYEMPEIDGVGLCRLIRAKPGYAELPVIMLSAAPEPPAHGVRHWTKFLRKPASIGELSAAIDAHAAARLSSHRSRRPVASVRARLKTLHPPASRWASVDSACWP